PAAQALNPLRPVKRKEPGIAGLFGLGGRRRSIAVVAIVTHIARGVAVVVDHGTGHHAARHYRRVFVNYRGRAVDHQGGGVISRPRRQRVADHASYHAGDDRTGDPAAAAPVATTMTVVAAVIAAAAPTAVVPAVMAPTATMAPAIVIVRGGAQRHRHRGGHGQTDRHPLADIALGHEMHLR